MTKLTDTQLVILSTAAQREDGAALPLPKSLKLKGAAVDKVLEALRGKGLLEEKPASREAIAWREGTDGRRTTLVITEAGLQAIGADAGVAPKVASAGEPAGRPAKARAKRLPKRTGRKAAAGKPKGGSASSTREGTKQALLIRLLERKSGASIEEIVEATGWQAHSVRGAISGTLKKKLGMAVSSEKVDGRGRVYRIAARG